VALLQLINAVQDEIKLPRSSAVVTSTDQQVRQLLSLANREVEEFASQSEWPRLRKFHEIVLNTATGTYLANFSAASTSITVDSVTGVEIGMVAQANGIPINATVTNISGLAVSLSLPTTEAGVDESITFGFGSYALPSDFGRVINDTEWDQTNRWAAIGPNTPQDWAWMTQGIVALTPRRHYRIMGNDTTEFFIWPVPTSDEDGQLLTFEYITNATVLPRVWLPSTVYAANATVSYGGRRYVTSAGGTSGATPPRVNAGSVSDGGVTWTYTDNGYTAFQADTDITILPQKIVELGVIWRWKRANGFPYTDDEKTWQDAVGRLESRQGGAPMLSLSRRVYNPLIGPWQVQDGNFPGPP
jgi:hypothetical protein